MRFIFFILVLAVSLSCSEGGAEKASVAITSPAPTDSPTISPSNIDHPCDVLSGTVIAQTLGWKGAHDAAPTTMRDGRLLSCFYASTNNAGAITITVSHSDERIIERKGLERNYAKNLSATDGPLSYEAITDGFGDETIYGYGKRGPSHTYRLRWRIGDQTDYSIDVATNKKMKKEVVLEQIKVLAEKM